MAAFNKLLQVFGLVNEEESKSSEPSITDNNLIVTISEFKEIVSKTKVPESNKLTQSSQQNISNFIMNMLKTEYDTVSARIADARRLIKIFPEFEDAVNILVSSILSPNNFFQYDVKLSITSNEITEEEKAKILEILTKHFTEQFNLSDELNTWLKKTMLITGSQPLLVLPYSAITKLRNSNIEGVSLESIKSQVSEISHNKIYSNHTYSNGKINQALEQKNISGKTIDIDFTHEDVQDIIIGMENLSKALQQSKKQFKTETKINNVKTTIINADNNVVIKELKSNYNKLKDKINNVTFVEDPTLILTNGTIRMKGKKNITKSLDEALLSSDTEIKNIQYKQETFLDISPYLIDIEDDENAIPLVMKLPSESVVPLTVPGSPELHIGYLIILNEYGEPITNIALTDEELLRYVNKEDELINSLYRTVTKNSTNIDSFFQNSLAEKNYLQVYKMIYSKFIEKLLNKNLEEIGIQNIDINITNNVLSMMLSRILSNKKTYVLFVPDNILTYFALEYDEKGLGLSRIENVKMIAALRMTYMITRLMSLMENAINTKRIEVEFDESIPNPLELAKEIRQELINSRIFNFSYEPSKIIKTLLEKEINFIPKNIPGVNSFDVNVESSQRNRNIPDSDLLEELNNMSTIGIGLTPSMFNQLKESEYSRTVATNNVIYSQKIKENQKKVIKLVNKFIKTYIKYYPKLINQIKDSIKSFYKDNSINEENLNIKVNEILNSLTINLPSPKIAHDKAIGEEIDSFKNISDTITENIFPDGIVPDDLRDSYEQFRTIFKSNLFKQFLETTNTISEFHINQAKNFDPTEIANLIKLLKNHDKLYKDMMKVLNSEEGGGY